MIFEKFMAIYME